MRKSVLLVFGLSFLMSVPAAAGSYNISNESGVTVYRGVEARPDPVAAARVAHAQQKRDAHKALQSDLRRQNRLIAAQTEELASLTRKVDALESRAQTLARRGRYGRSYIGNNRFFGRNGFVGNSNFSGATVRVRPAKHRHYKH